MAYLYGLLAHYALDSLSHPFVARMTEQGKATRYEIETEFDRFLLEMDGKKPPYLYDQSRHMQLTPGECETVAAFYPSVKASAVRKYVKNMAFCTRALVIPQGTRRDMAMKTMELTIPHATGLLMTEHPNRRCAKLDPSLLRLYEMAMDRYLVLLDQIYVHLRRNTPLGADFSAVFG